MEIHMGVTASPAPAHNAGQGLSNRHTDEPKGKDADQPHAGIDDSLGIGKQAHDRPPENQYRAGHDNSDADCHQGALLRAVLGPVKFAGTDILPGESGHGHPEGEIGHHGKTVHPHGDDGSGDKLRARSCFAGAAP